MNVERTKLCERLREARDYLGLSQEEVAKALGVPRTAISLLESGQRKIEALELKRLAELYKRPVSYFTGDLLHSDLPIAVQHLARAAAKLSETDRAELARFAEFLQARSAPERK